MLSGAAFLAHKITHFETFKTYGDCGKPGNRNVPVITDDRNSTLVYSSSNGTLEWSSAIALWI